MAYGVKYQCEWTSPMREQRRYVISILERDYEGDILPLYPRGDVLTITQGQIDADELQPIKASEASLSLLCIDKGDPYLSLFTTDPLQYMLLVERYYGGGLVGSPRRLVEWEGYLSAGVYSQNYANPPYHVSLSAADGIALLKDMPYLDADEKRFTGLRSVAATIADIIARISSRPVNYPWPMALVYPEQTEHTLEVLAVEAEGLYSSFGDEVPSCYEVLEAMLQSLGLQLFRSYGAWVVRPLASLATTQRARGVSYINNGYSIMPLYTDTGDDTGVSTSATLSLLAPYRSIKNERPETEEDSTDIPSMLDPSRWVKFANTSSKGWFKRGDMLRLQAFTPIETGKGDRYIGLVYIGDSILEVSAATAVSIDVDCYNLTNKENHICAGLFLVDAEATDPLSWLTPVEGKNEIVVDAVVAGYDPTTSSWVKLKADSDATKTLEHADLQRYMQAFTLPATRRHIFFDHPAKESQMALTSLNIAAESIGGVASKMRLVVVLTGALNGNLNNIELRKPRITFEQKNEVVVETPFIEDVEVSNRGLGEISYKQHFADSWLLSATGRSFQAPLIDSSSNGVLRGLVAPELRATLADVAVANIRLLRGQITRQIEGECYAKTMLDLDAMWRDREGRVYYTNYIRRHLKRGLYTVQLREMPAMAARVAVNAVYSGDMTDVVGLDTSAYWLSVNGRQAWRYDAQRDSVEMILSAPTGTYAMTLNAGQRAVSVVTFDGVYYALRAYDTHGELLSHIERLNDLTNVALTSGLLDGFARSARFDANTNTWVLIGGDSIVTYLQMLSRDGESYGLTTYSLGNYRGVVDATLMPNGFAYTSKPVKASSTTYAWWHSNAQHFDASVAALGSNLSVVACNEMYIAIANAATGSIGLHHRTDAMVGYDAPLVAFNASQVTFVAMNNALALFRRIDNIGELSYGAWVYDGRTGNIITLTAPLALPTTKLWISGNRIYGAWVDARGAHHFTAVNIISGGGTPKAEFVMPADDLEQ